MEVELPPNEHAAIVQGGPNTESSDDIPSAVVAANERSCLVVETLGVRVR